MKVRWTTNSVRLRITPAELDSLLRGHGVGDVLAVPGGTWSVRITPGAPEPSLRMDGAMLSIGMTTVDRDRLAEPGVEGVYFTTADSPSVRYFIEKDYPCAHPRTEDAGENSVPEGVSLNRASTAFERPQNFK